MSHFAPNEEDKGDSVFGWWVGLRTQVVGTNTLSLKIRSGSGLPHQSIHYYYKIPPKYTVELLRLICRTSYDTKPPQDTDTRIHVVDG